MVSIMVWLMYLLLLMLIISIVNTITFLIRDSANNKQKR